MRANKIDGVNGEYRSPRGLVPSYQKTLVHVVGDVVIFEKHYDPDQLWLPFMSGTIFTALPTQLQPERYHSAVDEINDRLEMDRIAPFSFGRQKIPQLVLRFDEYRVIPHNIAEKLWAIDYPFFERRSDGELYETVFGRDIEPDSVQKWCRENCVGYVTIYNQVITFELAEDALLAQLRF